MVASCDRKFRIDVDGLQGDPADHLRVAVDKDQAAIGRHGPDAPVETDGPLGLLPANEVVVHVANAAAQFSPSLPGECGVRGRLENLAHHGAELAGRGGAVELFHIHCHRPVVDQNNLIVFLLLEVGEFGGYGIGLVPELHAARIVVAARHLGADEVRQSLEIVEGKLADFLDDALLFLRGGWRNCGPLRLDDRASLGKRLGFGHQAVQLFQGLWTGALAFEILNGTGVELSGEGNVLQRLGDIAVLMLELDRGFDHPDELLHGDVPSEHREAQQQSEKHKPRPHISILSNWTCGRGWGLLGG